MPLATIRSFPGKAETGGCMHVTLCDYIMLWDSLSATQKKSLSQRYQMGCDCKVSRQRTICVSLIPSMTKQNSKKGSRYFVPAGKTQTQLSSAKTEHAS